MTVFIELGHERGEGSEIESILTDEVKALEIVRLENAARAEARATPRKRWHGVEVQCWRLDTVTGEFVHDTEWPR